MGNFSPVSQALEQEVRRATEQIPIAEFSEKDIFVVGYPKSGHTWFQNLSAGLLYSIDPECTPDTVIQELIPDVHCKRFYKRFGTPMIFKSHDLPRHEYRRVVYLLRDGRDVAVSHSHHISAVHRLPKDERWDSIEADARRWADHVTAWMENRHGAALLTIRFEDLLADPERELRRFCDFAELDRSDENLRFVAKQTSFEKMRAKEIASGWDNRDWPRDQAFIRRGITGSYKDEMPPAALESFERHAGSTLRRWGYPPG